MIGLALGPQVLSFIISTRLLRKGGHVTFHLTSKRQRICGLVLHRRHLSSPLSTSQPVTPVGIELHPRCLRLVRTLMEACGKPKPSITYKQCTQIMPTDLAIHSTSVVHQPDGGCPSPRNTPMKVPNVTRPPSVSSSSPLPTRLASSWAAKASWNNFAKAGSHFSVMSLALTN